MAKILIVEDEVIVAWDIKETLEGLGHTVVDLAISGIEAIQTATRDRPDLVLMDIRLNGEMDGIMTGDEIYQQLKIPIVYLTAHADEFTLERATKTNPFGYIVKPFHSQSLNSTVKVALQRYQTEASAQTAQISLGNALENLGSGIIVTNRQGTITFLNAVAQKLTGWSSADAVGIDVDRVFCLICETDGTSIENPCLRAMRCNESAQSPDRCWLVTKDRSTIPISDTATPIVTPDGEVVGGIIVFQDNTARLTTEVELCERNEDLKAFQLKLITQLQTKTEEHEHAIACLQLLDSVMETVWTAAGESALLTTLLRQLCLDLDADYCWITLHDRDQETARIACEHVNIEHPIYPTSKVGEKIDLLRHPKFYNQLAKIESWVNPPAEIIPTAYRNLLIPNARMTICPLFFNPRGSVVLSIHNINWLVGEIGIVTTDRPALVSFQSQAMVVQIFSHAIQLFRKIHLSE
jgi:PAS domain S-box-containing protein